MAQQCAGLFQSYIVLITTVKAFLHYAAINTKHFKLPAYHRKQYELQLMYTDCTVLRRVRTGTSALKLLRCHSHLKQALQCWDGFFLCLLCRSHFSLLYLKLDSFNSETKAPVMDFFSASKSWAEKASSFVTLATHIL